MMLTQQATSSMTATLPTQKGGVYIDQMMGLYNKYFYENIVNQLLAKEIESLNKKIGDILEDKNLHQHLLFCESDFDKAISATNNIKQKADFLLSGLLMVYRSTSDTKIKTLVHKSINVMQQFIIKIIEFGEVYGELKKFNGEIDENSIDYKNKMNEIAEYITSSKMTKTGNSIRELLNV